MAFLLIFTLLAASTNHGCASYQQSVRARNTGRHLLVGAAVLVVASALNENACAAANVDWNDPRCRGLGTALMVGAGGAAGAGLIAIGSGRAGMNRFVPPPELEFAAAPLDEAPAQQSDAIVENIECQTLHDSFAALCDVYSETCESMSACLDALDPYSCGASDARMFGHPAHAGQWLRLRKRWHELRCPPRAAGAPR
jgi:hypothetical protein